MFAAGVLAALAWEFATKDAERRRPLREAALAVGDPLAAFGAVGDELRLHPPVEVIVWSLPSGKSNRLEEGIVEQLRDELEIPVTHVVGSTERVPVSLHA